MRRPACSLIPVLLAIGLPALLRAETGPVPQPPPVVEVRPAAGVEIRMRSESPEDAGSPTRLEGLVGSDEWKLRSSVRVSPDPALALRVQRLDTGLQLQVPGPLQTLVLGDTLASGGGWSRPVRLGGLRLGRGLALRPDHEALAQPTSAAALPATPIGFDAAPPSALLPGPTRAAPAPVVAPVADMAGLPAGEADYELELGRLRSGWGTLEDRYGQAFVAGAYRRGLGHRFTAEARTEWSPSRQAAGLEIAHHLQGGAQVGAVVARSDTDTGSGLRTGMRLAGQALGARWRMAWDGFDPGWTPAAAAPDEVQPRMRLRASAQAELTRQLSAGLTVGGQSAWNAESERVLALSLRLALSQGRSLAFDVSERTALDVPRQHRVVLDIPLDTIAR